MAIDSPPLDRVVLAAPPPRLIPRRAHHSEYALILTTYARDASHSYHGGFTMSPSSAPDHDHSQDQERQAYGQPLRRPELSPHIQARRSIDQDEMGGQSHWMNPA
ncbi:hypothetical protein R3P38DRAFT_3182546 [Favolaschia claudopus]|uniref:Uncharacterized protein n=1 Tax=Favolaschia claudopus TaxID=2862362 RepID=A0AAW0CK90_9AGAR